MARDIEHRLWHESGSVMDLPPYRTGVWLADRPCTAKGVKGGIWPVQAMHAPLTGCPGPGGPEPLSTD